MLAELTGWTKLTELVTNHVLRDENGNMHATVVDSDCATYHIWRDRRAASPGLDNRAVVEAKRCYFLCKLGVNEWAFFE